MKIQSWDEFVGAGGRRAFAATIGVFDGVHRGHRRLMDNVLAKRPTLASAVITFRDNPKKLLHPQTFRGSIFSLGQKIELFGSAGFDLCVLIDFSRNFGTLSGAEFLSLLAAAGVKFLCVGPNFRCGHRMDTNAQALVDICGKLGIEALVAEPVLCGGHPVSSSRIRNAILEGRLGEASDMLGRPHAVEIEGSDLRSSGRVAFVPSAEALLPPDGAYVVVLNPEREAKMVEARIEGGLIVAEAAGISAVSRVAIINVVSQECKEK